MSWVVTSEAVALQVMSHIKKVSLKPSLKTVSEGLLSSVLETEFQMTGALNKTLIFSS